MGRPINKRWFDNVGNRIPIRFKTADAVYEGFILYQKSVRRFKCVSKDGLVTAVCTLTQGLGSNPVNNNEAVLIGLVNGADPVALRKITNRVVTDFAGRRYSWTASDDSTEVILVLIPH